MADEAPEPAETQTEDEPLDELAEVAASAQARGENPQQAVADKMAQMSPAEIKKLFAKLEEQIGSIPAANLELLRSAGAFDPPPEPVSPPAQPVVPPEARGEAPPAAPAPKSNFAQRFMGVG